jgi:hypothetical protein
MIQRILTVFNVIEIVLLISGSISLLYLSGISDTNLMTFAQKTTNSKEMAKEKVSFLTDAKVLIAGTYYSLSPINNNTSADAIIFLVCSAAIEMIGIRLHLL